MSSTVKNALKGGAVVGGGLFLVVAIAASILGPLAIASAWYFGVWSFEASVIALLLVVCYVTPLGGSNE